MWSSTCNYKSKLENLCRQVGLPQPIYRIINESGPKHSPIFQAEVHIQPSTYVGHAYCRKKLVAENSAAHVALLALNQESQENRNCSNFGQIQAENNRTPNSSISSSASVTTTQSVSITKIVSDLMQFSQENSLNISASVDQGRVWLEISDSSHFEQSSMQTMNPYGFNQYYPYNQTYYEQAHFSSNPNSYIRQEQYRPKRLQRIAKSKKKSKARINALKHQ